MSPHSTTRVPVDDLYVALVGKAVYVFAYYEWALIWIIELLRPAFVTRYCRGSPMTSGHVRNELQIVIDDPATSFEKVAKQALERILAEFESMTVKRNALIHAHPCTGTDAAQILAYQTKTTRQLPDMTWSKTEVEGVVAEFDKAACSACTVLDNLR